MADLEQRFLGLLSDEWLGEQAFKHLRHGRHCFPQRLSRVHSEICASLQLNKGCP